jgi:hypothetical protein
LSVVRAIVPIVASSVLAGLQPLRGIGITASEIRASLARGLRLPSELDWLELEQLQAIEAGVAHT